MQQRAMTTTTTTVCPGREISRRELLRCSGLGVGSLALAWLQAHTAQASPAPAAFDLRPKQPPRDARAKAVILMMQNGGPSQMDLFDPKPDLKKYNGKRHATKVE